MMSTAIAQSRVLVLNKSFMPIQITSGSPRVLHVYVGIAKVVDREYQTFDFKS